MGELRPAPVFCAATVARVTALTPHLVRITLVGERVGAARGRRPGGPGQARLPGARPGAARAARDGGRPGWSGRPGSRRRCCAATPRAASIRSGGNWTSTSCCTTGAARRPPGRGGRDPATTWWSPPGEGGTSPIRPPTGTWSPGTRPRCPRSRRSWRRCPSGTPGMVFVEVPGADERVDRWTAPRRYARSLARPGRCGTGRGAGTRAARRAVAAGGRPGVRGSRGRRGPAHPAVPVGRARLRQGAALHPGVLDGG